MIMKTTFLFLAFYFLFSVIQAQETELTMQDRIYAAVNNCSNKANFNENAFMNSTHSKVFYKQYTRQIDKPVFDKISTMQKDSISPVFYTADSSILYRVYFHNKTFIGRYSYSLLKIVLAE